MEAGSSASTSSCSGQQVKCLSLWFRLRLLVLSVDRASALLMTSSEFSLIWLINSDGCISHSNYIVQLTAVTSKVRKIIVRQVGMVMCCFGEWRRVIQVAIHWVFLSDKVSKTCLCLLIFQLECWPIWLAYISPPANYELIFTIFVIGHKSQPLRGVTLESLCPFGSCHRLQNLPCAD